MNLPFKNGFCVLSEHPFSLQSMEAEFDLKCNLAKGCVPRVGELCHFEKCGHNLCFRAGCSTLLHEVTHRFAIVIYKFEVRVLSQVFIIVCAAVLTTNCKNKIFSCEFSVVGVYEYGLFPPIFKRNSTTPRRNAISFMKPSLRAYGNKLGLTHIHQQQTNWKILTQAVLCGVKK